MKCKHCSEGHIPLGENFVTRYMAIDAGDLSLEGQSMGIEWGACPCCEGNWQECSNCASEMAGSISREDAKQMVGAGWSGLIDKLYDKIPEDVYVEQVKEKFGGLRFYVGSATEEIFNFIHEVEEESYTICEECGKPGETHNVVGWVLTLCDEHREKRTKERLERFSNKN